VQGIWEKHFGFFLRLVGVRLEVDFRVKNGGGGFDRCGVTLVFGLKSGVGNLETFDKVFQSVKSLEKLRKRGGIALE